MADGNIAFNASLNTGGFRSGAAELQGIANKMSSAVGAQFGALAGKVAAIGAAFVTVSASVRAFNEAISLGGKLNDLSARTGETAGNLLVLQRAFENAGLGADQVGSMLDRMSRYMVESTKAGSDQQKTLSALGLSFESLRGKSPTEQLQLLASAVSSVEDPAIRTKIAMEIFGRSGGELMPLLRAMGVELDIARQQLGSLPSVVDKSAAVFDKLGDSFAAIGNKGTELAAGILEKLAPALASVAERVASIDAAGLGQALGEYAVQTAKWVAETLKVSEAIEAVKTAIAGIGIGEVSKGFELLFTTAKIAGLNAVNTVVAAAMAAVQTVGGALQTLFSPDSTTMAFINGSFEMLGAKIASNISKYLADVLEQIPFMGAAAEAIRATQKEAEQAAQDISNIMYYEADNLKKEWGGIMAEMPKQFAESYQQNAKSPLFDLTSELAKQKELSAELASNIRAAGVSAGDFANALNNSPLKGGSLIDRLTGGSANSPFPSTTRGGGAQIPISIDPAAITGGATSGTGGGGGSRTAPPAPKTAAEYETEMRANAAAANYSNRAAQLEAQGHYSAAARAMERADRAAQRVRDNADVRAYLNREYGANNAGEAYEEYRRRTGMDRMSREEFEKDLRNKALSDEERRKNQKEQDDKLRPDAGGAGGPSGDKPATEGTLQKILTKIKERPILVA